MSLICFIFLDCCLWSHHWLYGVGVAIFWLNIYNTEFMSYLWHIDMPISSLYSANRWFNYQPQCNIKISFSNLFLSTKCSSYCAINFCFLSYSCLINKWLGMHSAPTNTFFLCDAKLKSKVWCWQVAFESVYKVRLCFLSPIFSIAVEASICLLSYRNV